MTNKQKLAIVAVCASIWIAADQFSKALLKNMLALGDVMSFGSGTLLISPTYNSGAFLSLGARMPVETRNLAFIYGVLLIMTGVLVWLLRSKSLNRMEVVAIAGILGGGLSNLWDRLVCDGRVYDFLNIGIGGLRTGIFNVADVGITVGVLLSISSKRISRK